MKKDEWTLELEERYLKKNVIVRDSNPHIWILRTQSYPLCYLGIVDNLNQVIVHNLKRIFTKIPEDGWKVIEYSYVSGQFWQIIATSVFIPK